MPPVARAGLAAVRQILGHTLRDGGMKSTPNAEPDLGHSGVPSRDVLPVCHGAQGVYQARKARTQQ